MTTRKLPFIITWIYICLLSVFQTLTLTGGVSAFFLIGCVAGSFFLVRFILSRLPDKLARIRFQDRAVPDDRMGILAAVVTVLIFAVYLAGQYPGGFSPDTEVQYAQATGQSPYNDWHPVLHTLLFLKLPLLAGGGFGRIVFFQLLCFGLAFGYLVSVLQRCGCPKGFLWAICLYVWLNPFLATYMMYPWKDIGMTIFVTLLLAYYIRIVCSGGKWLENVGNLGLFSMALAACAFMRHNAVLFVAPLACIVLFYTLKERKARVKLLLGLVACVVLIKGLYAVLDVQKPEKRVLETVGLPVTVWCNVMQKNPKALPEDTRAFLYELASPEAYESRYVTGSFNSIKWTGLIDNEKIDSLSYGAVLRYTLQCFCYAPRESFEALAAVTDVVWEVSGKYGPRTVSVSENQWGIRTAPIPVFYEFVQQETALLGTGIGRIAFGSVGGIFLLLLVFAMTMFSVNRASFIHILPLFFYNFGTMPLLSGPDYRFFLPTLLFGLPCLFLMLRDEREIPDRGSSTESERNDEKCRKS